MWRCEFGSKRIVLVVELFISEEVFPGRQGWKRVTSQDVSVASPQDTPEGDIKMVSYSKNR